MYTWLWYLQQNNASASFVQTSAGVGIMHGSQSSCVNTSGGIATTHVNANVTVGNKKRKIDEVCIDIYHEIITQHVQIYV